MLSNGLLYQWKKTELNDRLKLNIRHHLVNSMLGILQPISENGKILLISIQYGFFVFLKLWCCFCLLKKESRFHHNICVNTLSMETSYSRISHSKVPILKKKFIYCNRLIVSHLMHMELQFCQFNSIPSCNNFNDNLLTCKRFQGTGTSATLF